MDSTETRTFYLTQDSANKVRTIYESNAWMECRAAIKDQTKFSSVLTESFSMPCPAADDDDAFYKDVDSALDIIEQYYKKSLAE